MTLAGRLEPGTPVAHPRHGSGRVVADMGATVVVRFGGALEQIPADEVVATSSLHTALRDGTFDDPIDAVVRAQALAIASVLTPNLTNSMIAVSLMWWPWYARLVYGLSSALRTEYFVSSAETIGARTRHILFREILPNMVSPIFTKMSLDVGWVIIIGSMLSFLGLGVQEPQPGLGTMVAKGSDYLPTGQWWISIFPALAIVVVVLGFNLLGDGIRDLFSAEEV